MTLSSLRDIAPFAAAVILVFFGPVIDNITWKRNYQAYYKEYGTGVLSEENLTNSAQWAVDLAQVFPGCVLAWLGAILVLPKVNTFIAVITLAVPLIPLIVAHRSGKYLHQTREVVGPYTGIQFLVIAVNVLSAVVVVWNASDG